MCFEVGYSLHSSGINLAHSLCNRYLQSCFTSNHKTDLSNWGRNWRADSRGFHQCVGSVEFVLP